MHPATTPCPLASASPVAGPLAAPRAPRIHLAHPALSSLLVGIARAGYPVSRPHLEIIIPGSYLGPGRWEPSVVLGSARIDECPDALADQFFPYEAVTVVEGYGPGHVASIQVGDQDDEGYARAVTIAEIWEAF